LYNFQVQITAGNIPTYGKETLIGMNSPQTMTRAHETCFMQKENYFGWMQSFPNAIDNSYGWTFAP